MTRSRRTDPQLDLFPGAADGFPRGKTKAGVGSPGAAPPTDDAASIARRLPGHIRLGTSSWSFPGWAGIVFDREANVTQLARHGLAAYARHPLLRTVCIDRAYYGPLTVQAYAAYADVVPEDFRFVVKAHELCTVARFPGHARYGAQRGERNDRFLDVAYATDRVVGPMLDGLGTKAGPLLFQFPPQSVAALGGPARFAERLQTFLAALPRGPVYAVELRNDRLLTPAYAQSMAAVGAVHCLNVHPTMPEPHVQTARLRSPGTQPLVVRWMLPRHLRYEEARERYQPFDRIVDDDPATRGGLAHLCARARGPVYVTINNKAEGSAPLSVFRLAGRIVDELERS
jgi:uncharacterized protein YecE (DUF72 family)